MVHSKIRDMDPRHAGRQPVGLPAGPAGLLVRRAASTLHGVSHLKFGLMSGAGERLRSENPVRNLHAVPSEQGQNGNGCINRGRYFSRLRVSARHRTPQNADASWRQSGGRSFGIPCKGLESSLGHVACCFTPSPTRTC